MVALRVAIQMDPIDAIDINGDTSFRLALEAQNRGHSVYVYKPEDLSWDEGVVSANLHPVTLRDKVGDHVTNGTTTFMPLFNASGSSI